MNIEERAAMESVHGTKQFAVVFLVLMTVLTFALSRNVSFPDMNVSKSTIGEMNAFGRMFQIPVPNGYSLRDKDIWNDNTISLSLNRSPEEWFIILLVNQEALSSRRDLLGKERKSFKANAVGRTMSQAEIVELMETNNCNIFNFLELRQGLAIRKFATDAEQRMYELEARAAPVVVRDTGNAIIMQLEFGINGTGWWSDATMLIGAVEFGGKQYGICVAAFGTRRYVSGEFMVEFVDKLLEYNSGKRAVSGAGNLALVDLDVNFQRPGQKKAGNP